ncbi:Uma2 family endonuclease [Fulvimarina sp. 2208YS6-2-32]|uniref:Uma2 family endonuclease n=1 Tax=Fulvimarina uroteuthidis TaxID=3098149 RepID=A0ABU5I0V2_9HYPH|nr:Uma2 family endonuclease [Fulvimarina sp. 2208YS6-2-32]MDY8109020.1 Uma2 family endonuclease [Fulvimarina sp. 2208YS6-2-32]
MSDLRDFEPWTLPEFFAWQEGQSERFELVGGFPLKMMTGASNRHDLVAVNILAELRNRLRGSPCRPFTADGAVETFPGQIRRPDAGIDCGKADLDAYMAKAPTAVFEVLSPSTRDFDRIRKVEEYKSVSTMRHIVIIEPTLVSLVHVSRTSGDAVWETEMLNGIDQTLDLTGAGIQIPVLEIYAGLFD